MTLVYSIYIDLIWFEFVPDRQLGCLPPHFLHATRTIATLWPPTLSEAASRREEGETEGASIFVRATADCQGFVSFSFSKMAILLRLLLLSCTCTCASLPRPPASGCDGSNYTACRRELWKYVFNTTTGELPTKSVPDFIEDLPTYEMRGLPGPGQGTGVGDVRWRIGLQKLVWTIGLPGGGMRPGHLRLNTTVWYSRNTSGDAPSNSPPAGFGIPATDSPHCPDSSRPGYASYLGRSDTLVIHHNGHSPCAGADRSVNCSDCTPNFDTTQDFLNQLGYDVMSISMPLHGCNRIVANESCAKHCVSDAGRGFDCSQCRDIGSTASMVGSHQWFEQFEEAGDEAMRYFLEPVVLVANYAANVLGYKHLVMVGLSGGGWTTTIMAAIDPRISLSMPIAGSVPKFRSALYPFWMPDLPEGKGKGEGGGGDFEQSRDRPFYGACGWACLYTLAAFPGRHSLQMLHEHDSCCFATAGLHANISHYNRFVQGQLRKSGDSEGWFQTAANWGNFHEVNYRDKTLIGVMIERLRRPGGIRQLHYSDLPFNIL